MNNKRRKFDFKQWVLVVSLLVGFGTLMALFAAPPEEVRLSSSDGLFSIQGNTTQETEVTIKELPLAQSALVYSRAYEITVDGQVSPLPFSVSYKASSQNNYINSLVFYRYLDLEKVWQAVPTNFDHTAGILSTEANLLQKTNWMIGKSIEFSTPSFTPVMLDQLLSDLPEGTVGYRVFSAFAPEGDEYVLYNISLDFGGCAGHFKTGQSQKVEILDRDADGKKYRLGVIWEIAQGCEPGQEINSSN